MMKIKVYYSIDDKFLYFKRITYCIYAVRRYYFMIIDRDKRNRKRWTPENSFRTSDKKFYPSDSYIDHNPNLYFLANIEKVNIINDKKE